MITPNSQIMRSGWSVKDERWVPCLQPLPTLYRLAYSFAVAMTLHCKPKRCRALDVKGCTRYLWRALFNVLNLSSSFLETIGPRLKRHRRCDI